MRWSVADNAPDLITPEQVDILCDGERVDFVRAFDDEEGWVDALHAMTADEFHNPPNCPGLREEERGELRDNPDDAACEVRVEGEIEVRVNGEPLEEYLAATEGA